MHSIEHQLCNSALKTIKSPELKKVNYIFMEPVETSYFPDYLEKIQKPMDLSTLTTNLNEKRYASYKEFFQDAALMYQNARVYHKGRADTKYVLQIADSLEKLLKREEKRVKKTFNKYKEEKRERKKERKMQSQLQEQIVENDLPTQDPVSNLAQEKDLKKEKSKKPLLKLKLSSRTSSSIEESKSSAKSASASSSSIPVTTKLKDTNKRSKSEKTKKNNLILSKPTSPSSSSSSNNDIAVQNKPPSGSSTQESSINIDKQSNADNNTKKNNQFTLKFDKLNKDKEKSIKSSSKNKRKDEENEKNVPIKAKSVSKVIKPKLKLRFGDTKVKNENKKNEDLSLQKSKVESESIQSPSISNQSDHIAETKKSKPKVKLSFGTKKSSKSTTEKTEDKNSRNSVGQKSSSLPPEPSTPSSRGKEASSKKKTDSSNQTVPSKSEDSKGKGSHSKSSNADNPPVNVPPSRGKELPKAVATAKKEKSTSAASSTPTLTKTNSSSNSKPSSDVSASKPKIRLGQPSRGKEIPKAATLEPENDGAKSKTQSKSSTSAGNSKSGDTAAKITLSFGNKKNQSSKSTPSTGSKKTILNAPMNSTRKIACAKVLSGLKRREPINSSWFLEPQSDPRILDDYNAKIQHPMDLGRVASKLEKNEYSTLAEFVCDLRRIFANCLRYNTDTESNLRPAAIQMLTVSENLIAFFINRHETSSIYPPLLYNWKKCLDVLDSILEMKNPDDKLQTAHYFLHSVSFFFHGQWPTDYLTTIKTPMDFGTVVSKMIEGEYQSVSDFAVDCRLVWENCILFNGGKEVFLTEKAERLKKVGNERIETLLKEDNQEDSKVKMRGYQPSPKIVRPQESFLLKMLQDLRMTTYTDRWTKLTESATIAFEKPVDTSFFTDYRDFVECPMDLETIEQKIKNDEYEAPEDFEYDVLLIFKNCEKYNIPKKNDLIVVKAKHCATKFRKMYSARIKIYLENNSSSSTDSKINLSTKEKHKSNEEKRDKKRAHSKSPNPESKANKKPKLESKGSVKSSKKVKSSASSVSVSSTGNKKNSKTVSSGKGKSIENTTIVDENAPVELIVAMRQVKENFSPRRNIKELEPWEIACAKVIQTLVQHPWLRARNAAPKFNFHAPVPMVYPEVKVAYSEKIKNPMDLTTVEAKLMQGGHYTCPQHFVNEVALVFDNGITFNEQGHIEGEPIACSYYDASKHLIRYTRWLSLEYLSTYLVNEEMNGDREKLYGPVIRWELTTINHEDSKKEMENLVMQEPLVKSDYGDKYSWMESECEKLLKALRRQTDTRLMTYFILSQYPPDYSAFVAKPMSWEKVSSNLQNRLYNTLGEVVEDLRLIFSNALKYNFRAKGTDTVSGKAYDAAVAMSAKLEAAIDAMLLSVSDRLERDKIDRLTIEREADAIERVNEERAHAARLAQRETERQSTEVKRSVVTYQTVKVIQAKQPKRQELDFDLPLYEEDESHRERSQGEAERQRQLFDAIEKQQRLHIRMQKISLSVGVEIYSRLAEREAILNLMEKKWKEKNKHLTEKTNNMDPKHSADKKRSELHVIPDASNDQKSSLLSDANRPKVVVTMNSTRKVKKRKPRSHLILEEF